MAEPTVPAGRFHFTSRPPPPACQLRRGASSPSSPVRRLNRGVFKGRRRSAGRHQTASSCGPNLHYKALRLDRPIPTKTRAAARGHLDAGCQSANVGHAVWRSASDVIFSSGEERGQQWKFDHPTARSRQSSRLSRAGREFKIALSFVPPLIPYRVAALTPAIAVQCHAAAAASQPQIQYTCRLDGGLPWPTRHRPLRRL